MYVCMYVPEGQLSLDAMLQRKGWFGHQIGGIVDILVKGC